MGGVVNTIADDFLGLDDSGGIAGSVSKIGSSFEDTVRDAVDDVDSLVQNPYVRMAVRFIPGVGQTAGAILDAYAKLDSGEDLTATDLANIGLSAGTDIGDWEVTDATRKAIKTSAAIADGGDPIKILVSAYGEDVVDQMGLKDAAITNLQEAIGEDAYNLVSDNLDLARVGYDVMVEGKDPLEAISNRYGEEIVGYLGADTANERALGLAGLTTAVALDQGLDSDDAVLRGARRYRDEGGTVDLQQLADLTGVTVDFNSNDFFNKYAATLGGFEGLPDLAFVEDYVREYSPYIEDSVRFVSDQIPNINLDGASYDYLRDTYNLSLRDLRDMDVNIDSLQFDTDIDLGLPSIEVSDIDVPNIEGFDIPLPGLEPADRGPFEIAQLETQKREELVQQAEEEEIPISELLLSDFQLKNPLLKG